MRFHIYAWIDGRTDFNYSFAPKKIRGPKICKLSSPSEFRRRTNNRKATILYCHHNILLLVALIIKAPHMNFIMRHYRISISRALTILVLLLSCCQAFCSTNRGKVTPSIFASSGSHLSLSNTSLRQASISPPLERQSIWKSFTGIVTQNGRPTQESFLERHPFLSAVLITTANAALADLLTQVVFQGGTWNKARTALFATFGFIYQGVAQYAIVNWGWERAYPGTSRRNIIAKICGMNFVTDPALFMPCFYIFRECMAQGGLSIAIIKAALIGYKSNCLVDWRNSWSLWLPGHAVTYSLPTHKRIPWMAFLSFFYMCVLSLTRGG